MLIADQATRLCFYWIPAASGGVQSVGMAVLDPDSSIPFVNSVDYERKLVNLGYKEGDDQTEYILGENTAGVQASGGVTIIENTITNVQQPSQAQIGELLVMPLSVATTEVYVQPGIYLKASDNSKQYWPGDTTFDLTAAIGSIGAGSHQIAWICLDTNGGTLFSQFGSIVAATNALPAPYEFSPSDILGISVNSAYKADVPVYLYHGQASVIEANILRNYDQRFVVPPGSNSNGGTVTNVTASAPLASSGGATPNISLQNATALIAAGLPVIAGSVHLTAQTSAIADTNIVTPSSDGQYQVALVLTDTTTGISGTMTATITWTDYNGVQTFASSALNVASVGEVDFVKTIYAKSSAAIKYRVDLTTVVGTPAFAIDVKLIRMS